MPQEPQNSNRNNTQRPANKRRSRIDSFRWDFVPEDLPNPAAGFVPPAKKKKLKLDDNYRQPEKKKTDRQPPKGTARTAGLSPPAEPSAKPHQSRKRTRRKTALPHVSPALIDENDEELRLPSYGRTPVPDDDELLLPPPKRTEPLRTKPPKQKPPQAEPPAESQESRPPGLQHREQMVWDPDKLQYVPLVTKKEKRTAGETASRKNIAVKHPLDAESSRPLPKEQRPPRQTPPHSPKRKQRSAKPLPPLSPSPNTPPELPQTTKDGTFKPERRTEKEAGMPERRQKKQEQERSHPQKKTSGVPAHSSSGNFPAKKRERVQRDDSPRPVEMEPVKTAAVQRGGGLKEGDSQMPYRMRYKAKFVESARPDPADIESEASGFAELGVSETMLEALKVVRYLEPTPIQSGVFKKVQAGTDLMGQAQTGTGKTAAFSIPIIEGIETCPPGSDPVALILVPTRELAVQVRDEAERLAYGREVRITACYGGKPLGKQIARLKEGIDIVVGTPGRILDLMNRGALSLNAVRWVVLDEADRMLDIGFRPQIEKILRRTPQDRQTLLFSATLPQPVVRLAERYMNSPEVLDFSNKSVAVDTIDQFYVTVDPERKFDALVHLLKEQEPKQAIIFTRTKRGADRLARLLSKHFSNLAAIHGDLAQSDRDRVMAQVRAGSLRYLVATDVVGRGIDVSGISHIINYDIPQFCDDYVHRVGRTGRMGREGVAFTFVTAEQGSELTRIEMRIDKLLKRADLQGFEAFTKPHDPNVTLGEEEVTEPPKPVFGKRVRKVRKAL
ncbi:MAG: DEAD/DEAH box helicase [Planctomycetaceae bacterium]|jgi:ATP-dependent RNA helicase DeaD|nr:DEAD/DEAH box helicase [Planctomycetaceae bacterium]